MRNITSRISGIVAMVAIVALLFAAEIAAVATAFTGVTVLVAVGTHAAIAVVSSIVWYFTSGDSAPAVSSLEA